MNSTIAGLMVLVALSAVMVAAELCDQYPDIVGCQQLNAMQKRKSAYMRFGRSAPSDDSMEPMAMEKRKSAYMRFGKRSGGPAALPDELPTEEAEQRLRFIKRKSAYMRFGKRSMPPMQLVPVDLEPFI